MSPAVARRKPEIESASVPAVAEAIARRHEADTAEKNRLLAAYRVLVKKAANNEPLTSADADSAVVAAHALGLHGDRLDRDVAALRQAQGHETAMADYKAASPACNARLLAIKAELVELHKTIASLRAEHHRLSVRGHIWLAHKQNHDEITKNNPHLFLDASEISDADWQKVRA